MFVSRVLWWVLPWQWGLVLPGCGTPHEQGSGGRSGAPLLSTSRAPRRPARRGGGHPHQAAAQGLKTLQQTITTGQAWDTLIRIGLESGQSWKDIARWNNLENANLIEVGQVLRVLPFQPRRLWRPENGVVTRPVTTSSIRSCHHARCALHQTASGTKPAALRHQARGGGSTCHSSACGRQAVRTTGILSGPRRVR